MKTFAGRCWAVALAGTLCMAAQVRAEEAPPPSPVPVLEGQFAFTPGSWAAYAVRDEEAGRDFRMTIAILEEGRVRGRSGRWMEIEVVPESDPPVVTRILARETPDGPGDLLQVIVQVEGMDPFRVPRRYLRPKEGEPGQFQTITVPEKVEQSRIEWRGRTLTAWTAVTRDEADREVTVVVSEDAPPLGLVSVEGAALRMTLEDWGMDAQTRLTGRPIGFLRWIFRQVGRGMRE